MQDLTIHDPILRFTIPPTFNDPTQDLDFDNLGHKATIQTNHPNECPMAFCQWKLDIMGPFSMAMRQLKFLVIEIDYFIKWVEIEPLTTITEKNACSFVWKRIICRFGIPRVLIFDNGKQFNNDAFRDFCNQSGIKNHYSSPAHPQANEQIEITN